ncbi:hypothetical protein [Mycolicibacterium nivoides]|uniref:Uncharacterized protein n=1 Tax=Mycolicibacterium nivoides TaxID=2487344 RepID=A0ABW9LIS5_9MYCO
MASDQFVEHVGDLSARGVDVGEHPLIGWLGEACTGEDSNDDSF